MNQITLTDACTARIAELVAEENNPNVMLRVFIEGGGCSGMQYGFTFEETKNEDDFEIVKDNVRLLVDSMSMMYLEGSTIDFKEDLYGAAFSIQNPQAQTTCGCGSSFSV